MRLKSLRKKLSRMNKFPYLISNLKNIFYLTGFEGSYGHLVIDRERSFFISDSRYREYAKEIIPESIEFILQKRNIIEALKNIFNTINKDRVYIEDSIPLSFYLMLKKELGNIEIIPNDDEVSAIRIIKDDGELGLIRKAVEISDRCFKHLTGIMKPGMLEWDLAVEIEYFYRKNGCRKSAFDSVVASGKGSSMPHYLTSMTKRIDEGDILLIDMGCEYEGYNSDLTRTIFLGYIDPEFEKIYNIVKCAQEKAISFLRPGISASRVDRIARDIIAEKGYGEAFGHALGHGVGLDVHEQPSIKMGNKFRLKKNVVITIEPGIYLPDSGGVRIEDIVIINDIGYEVITKSSKEIIVI
ncbi:MAG: Xaa-Pro peptidase family protein [Spirochaetota bacterium]|nr:Xaa-Pro peptidase family protein [Spirochaetota bacterium]